MTPHYTGNLCILPYRYSEQLHAFSRRLPGHIGLRGERQHHNVDGSTTWCQACATFGVTVAKRSVAYAQALNTTWPTDLCRERTNLRAKWSTFLEPLTTPTFESNWGNALGNSVSRRRTVTPRHQTIRGNAEDVSLTALATSDHISWIIFGPAFPAYLG